LQATKVNDYLKELKPGLTAKSFRTYHASALFEKELKKASSIIGFKKANLEVAKLCNHKKAVNKTAIKKTLERINKRKQRTQDQISMLRTKK
jgi:hypothetical protein